MQGGTRAQVSVGWLNEPHVSEPGDVTRVTASIEQHGTLARAPGRVDAGLGVKSPASRPTSTRGCWKATLGLWRRGTGYLRGEIADKHIIGAGGLHPPGVQHPHIVSTVSALTLGLPARDSGAAAPRALPLRSQSAPTSPAIVVPDELEVPYGRPLSVHLYGRWVFGNGNRPAAAQDPGIS